MRILVIGSGGREHAIAQKIFDSPKHPDVYCAPGNAGTAQVAENIPIKSTDIPALLEFAKRKKIDLTIAGPEQPLTDGIVDEFQTAGLRIFGPNKKAAQLEADKDFAKKLMVEAGIPTAQSRTFTRYDHAMDYIATRDTPQVVKVAGLAAGKGVFVCDDPADALLAAERILVKNEFGPPGNTILVEEKLVGQEISIHAITDGQSVHILESSRDHKRAFDNDVGPNTGGMGAYSPFTPTLHTGSVADFYTNMETHILLPILDTLRRHEIEYKGVLYLGLMITAGGPQVLEFNCRFGDPEAQVLFPRMKTDFIDVANACIDGRLDRIEIESDPRPAVCVVMASGGYPGHYEINKPITGIEDAESEDDVTVYHAGTTTNGDRLVTHGGRVLGVTAIGDELESAQKSAYTAASKINFEGAHYRKDIAHQTMRTENP